MTNPTCPYCGRADWEEGPKFNGHKSYCKQHPESRKATPKDSGVKDSGAGKPSASPAPPSASGSLATGAASTTTSTLQPVTFTFSEGERLPSQQEIPEFKTPEQAKADEGKTEPTQKATLAEERKAGVTAITALILPLFDMANNALTGEAIQVDKDKVKFNARDAEMLAQAIILVDEKHGGPLSKTLGGDYGPEIFLAGVCIGLGVKATLMIRNRVRRPSRPSAAPSSEEIPRKNPLQEVGDSLRNLVTPKKKEEKPPGEEKPEGAMDSDKFMEYAKDYQDKAIVH